MKINPNQSIRVQSADIQQAFPNLKEGQVLRVNILEKIDEDRAILYIRGKKVVAQVPQNLNPNEPFYVKVLNTGLPIELKIITKDELFTQNQPQTQELLQYLLKSLMLDRTQKNIDAIEWFIRFNMEPSKDKIIQLREFINDHVIQDSLQIKVALQLIEKNIQPTIENVSFIKEALETPDIKISYENMNQLIRQLKQSIVQESSTPLASKVSQEIHKIIQLFKTDLQNEKLSGPVIEKWVQEIGLTHLSQIFDLFPKQNIKDSNEYLHELIQLVEQNFSKQFHEFWFSHPVFEKMKPENIQQLYQIIHNLSVKDQVRLLDYWNQKLEISGFNEKIDLSLLDSIKEFASQWVKINEYDLVFDKKQIIKDILLNENKESDLLKSTIFSDDVLNSQIQQKWISDKNASKEEIPLEQFITQTRSKINYEKLKLIPNSELVVDAINQNRDQLTKVFDIISHISKYVPYQNDTIENQNIQSSQSRNLSFNLYHWTSRLLQILPEINDLKVAEIVREMIEQAMSILKHHKNDLIQQQFQQSSQKATTDLNLAIPIIEGDQKILQHIQINLENSPSKEKKHQSKNSALIFDLVFTQLGKIHLTLFQKKNLLMAHLDSAQENTKKIILKEWPGLQNRLGEMGYHLSSLKINDNSEPLQKTQSLSIKNTDHNIDYII